MRQAVPRGQLNVYLINISKFIFFPLKFHYLQIAFLGCSDTVRPCSFTFFFRSNIGNFKFAYIGIHNSTPQRFVSYWQVAMLCLQVFQSTD